MAWLRDVDSTCRIFKSIAEPSLIMIRKIIWQHSWARR